MNPTLAGVALAVTAGAVIAASAREARAAYIGLVLALCLGPFLADPLPGSAVLGTGVVTGILVAYLLRAAAGAEGRGLGSRIGWPAEAMLASAAAVAGLALAGSLAALQSGVPGPAQSLPDALTPSALALAAGLAVMAVGLAPAFLARTPTRAAIGLLLAAEGLVLARTGIAGPPGELEQLGIDGFLLALGAAGALIATMEGWGALDSSPPHAAPSVR